ncbi:hypothetical protein [Vibrio owensii]|uniref:hypothetical protein n=1 Tax=Vibrio harveyi group TaxID=717610 RepID=UPI003CC65688
MSDLVERIQELENKERFLDNLIAQVQDLQSFVDDWDSNDPDRLPRKHENQINPIRRLIKMTRPSLKQAGTITSSPEKYDHSTYQGHLIDSITAHSDGKIQLFTSAGSFEIETSEDIGACSSADSILCEIQSHDGIEVKK